MRGLSCTGGAEQVGAEKLRGRVPDSEENRQTKGSGRVRECVSLGIVNGGSSDAKAALLYCESDGAVGDPRLQT